MAVTFLAPLFLFAAFAVVIPILIHLYRRERSQQVVFPSLMFLSRIPYRSVRQQRIRHWLLLLLRCAALGLVALAFARPLLQAVAVADVAGAQRRDVLILVDRSYSMGYDDHWQRALAEARSAVDALGPQDRATLVAFDERATALVQPTGDLLRLHAAIDTLELSPGVTRLGSALKLARRLLVESELPHREVVLISDLQKAGWIGGEEVRLPPGTEVSIVDLSASDPANLAVHSVLLDRRRVGERERVAVSARVTNRGEAAFSGVPLVLALGGREVQSVVIDLSPDSSQTVRFEPEILSGEELARGTVSAQGDALEADNAFHFVLSPGHGLGVLILESGRSSSLYVERSLELGQRPFFRVRSERSSRLEAADLADVSVVVVNDAMGELGEGGGRLLAQFVASGGGLLVSLGGAYRGGEVAAAEALGLGPPEMVSRQAEWGGTLAFLDTTHPALEVFSAPRSGDFTAARFFRYHELTAREEDRPLARFDDGKPALLERRVGEGRVLVFPTSLDTEWNNLALQPVYLPFLHQLIKHVASYAVAREWYTVGQVAEVDPGSPGAEEEWLVLAPSGGQQTVKLEPSTLVELEEQGFYEVRPIDPGPAVGEEGRGSDRALTLAVNVDASESDLTSLDREELAAAISPLAVAAAAEEQTVLAPEEREGRQRLWWYLLLAALLILGVESLLANRLSLGRATAQ